MKVFWRYLKRALWAIGGVVVLCGFLFCCVRLSPGWRLSHDLELFNHPQELLQLAHHACQYPYPFGGDRHDAYIAITQYGGPDSVRYLMKGLRKEKDTHGVVVCTKSHCLGALQKYTGEDCGENYHDWAIWWEETGRHITPQVITFPAIVTTNWVSNSGSSHPTRLLKMSCETQDGKTNTFKMAYWDDGRTMGGEVFPALLKLKAGDTCWITVSALWLGKRPKVTSHGQLCGKLIGLVETKPVGN